MADVEAIHGRCGGYTWPMWRHTWPMWRLYMADVNCYSVYNVEAIHCYVNR